jgi:polyhydroxybutyrate depolymerase
MKKKLLLIPAIAFAATSFAQLDTIQNNLFDNWTGNEPNKWGSSNAISAGSVSKAIGGDVLGANTLVLTTQPSSSNPIPGVVVSNGTYTVSGTTPIIKGGSGYRLRPMELTYVCKYNSGGGSDAPLVQVVLTRWVAAKAASGSIPAVKGHRDTLGISRSTSAGSTYAKQTLAISYSKNPAGGNPTSITNYATGAVSPDSVQILIASSGKTGAVANSTFFIDSLAFVYNCDLDPKIKTSGTDPILIPTDGATLTASAGQPFSIKITSFIPKTVTVSVPVAGLPNPISLPTTIDSVEVTSSSLSGSAANFMTVDATPTGGKTGGNSIQCITLSGTIPASPANATYNLILTPIMWGVSSVAPLSDFPSPQTTTYSIKVGSGSPQYTSTDNIRWRTTKFAGKDRVYNVYVPSIYDGSKAVPLVFNIHGWTGSSTKQMDFANFNPIADTANFIVVSPQATGTVPSWDLTGTTDTDFLMNLLDTLESQYKIDTNRVYSTGFSQGGMMSYILACSHSTRIAAVAPVAGGMTQTTLSSCKPSHYMPLMEIHGTSDILANYTTAPSVQTLLDYWVGVNHCNATPAKTTLPDLTTVDGSTVEHYVYDGGLSNTSVEHYKVLLGGHEWPTLAPGTKNNYGLNNRNLDFNASKEIWRFFSKYNLKSLDVVNGINDYSDSNNLISLYPNPTSGSFTLDVKNYPNAKVKITDLLGNTVFESTIKSQLTKIELNNIATGIYIYQVLNQYGSVNSGKLFVGQ